MYGADGYEVVNDTVNFPSYAQVSVSNQSQYTWAASTSDVRALQKATTADRIAATWYSAQYTSNWYDEASFDIDINLTDSNAHQVAVYCIDWDLNGRVQRIDVLDAASSALLDSRNISGFSNGQYLIWNVSGHVKLRVTKTAGANAVASGLFFQPIAGGFSPSQTTSYGYQSNPQAGGVAPAVSFDSIFVNASKCTLCLAERMRASVLLFPDWIAIERIRDKSPPHLLRMADGLTSESRRDHGGMGCRV